MRDAAGTEGKPSTVVDVDFASDWEKKEYRQIHAILDDIGPILGDIRRHRSDDVQHRNSFMDRYASFRVRAGLNRHFAFWNISGEIFAL